MTVLRSPTADEEPEQVEADDRPEGPAIGEADEAAPSGDLVAEGAGAESGLSMARTATGGLTLQFALDIPKVPSLAAVSTWTHQQLINGALIVVVAAIVAVWGYGRFFASKTVAEATAEAAVLGRANVVTDFNRTADEPSFGQGSFVEPDAAVIGAVRIGDGVYVGPLASIRGDEGGPIVIGNGSNVQDLVSIHAPRTFDQGRIVEENLVSVGGEHVAVWIGEDVTLAHQAAVHGPTFVGNAAYIGAQALIVRATIEAGVIVEPGAVVIGVTVAEGHYVPAGSVVADQAAADALPKIEAGYAYTAIAAEELQVHHALARARLAASGEAHVTAGDGSSSAASHASSAH